MARNGTDDGKIIDELNDIIDARNRIRTTMVEAGIAQNTHILKELADSLYNAKKAAATYNVSTSDQSIPAGKLTTGTQTFRAVTTSNIAAGNIKTGVVVKVGDSASAGRIKNVTGSYDKEDTNPIAASTVLKDKIGYVNGSKVTGTMANNGAGSTTTLTGTTTSKEIAAGYWSSANTVKVNTMDAPTVTLTNASQSISCKDKMMTGNISIPAVNFYYTGSALPSSTSGYNEGDLWLII